MFTKEEFDSLWRMLADPAVQELFLRSLRDTAALRILFSPEDALMQNFGLDNAGAIKRKTEGGVNAIDNNSRDLLMRFYHEGLMFQGSLKERLVNGEEPNLMREIERIESEQANDYNPFADDTLPPADPLPPIENDPFRKKFDELTAEAEKKNAVEYAERAAIPSEYKNPFEEAKQKDTDILIERLKRDPEYLQSLMPLLLNLAWSKEQNPGATDKELWTKISGSDARLLDRLVVVTDSNGTYEERIPTQPGDLDLNRLAEYARSIPDVQKAIGIFVAVARPLTPSQSSNSPSMLSASSKPVVVAGNSIFASDDIKENLERLRQVKQPDGLFQLADIHANKILSDFAVNRVTEKIEYKTLGEVGSGLQLDTNTQRPLDKSDLDKINIFFQTQAQQNTGGLSTSKAPQTQSQTVAGANISAPKSQGLQIDAVQFASGLSKPDFGFAVLNQFAALATKDTLNDASNNAIASILRKHRGNKVFCESVGGNAGVKELVFDVAKNSPEAALKIFKGTKLMEAAGIDPEKQAEIILKHMTNPSEGKPGKTFLDRLTASGALRIDKVEIDFKAVANSGQEGIRFAMLTTPKLAEKLGKDFGEILKAELNEKGVDTILKKMSDTNFLKFIEKRAEKKQPDSQFLLAAYKIQKINEGTISQSELPKMKELMESANQKGFELAGKYLKDLKTKEAVKLEFHGILESLDKCMIEIKSYLDLPASTQDITMKKNAFVNDVKEYLKLREDLRDAKYEGLRSAVPHTVFDKFSEYDRNQRIQTIAQAETPVQENTAGALKNG